MIRSFCLSQSTTRVDKTRQLHPDQTAADRHIAARQLLQRSHALLTVVDSTEEIRAQQFGQLARIDAIALASGFQERVLARITHQHLLDMRPEQVL